MPNKMCRASLGDLRDFVVDYAQHKSFQGYDPLAIVNELAYAVEGSRLFYTTDSDGKISGTVLWTQTELKTIHVSQLIAKNSQARNTLLCELYALFGDEMRVTYCRGSRVREISNNRKFLQKAIKA